MNEARLRELLADRALGALEQDEARELERELALHPERDDRTLEEACGALVLAHVAPAPLPAALRARLSAEGARWSAERRRELAAGSASRAVDPRAASPARTGAPAATARPAPPSAPERAPSAARASEPARPKASLLPWLVSAAALVIALLGWLREPAPAARLSPALAREQLLEQAPDLVQLEWSATADPAASGARGDVVWSDARQEGYMHFVGLAPNDPRREQYQLWIFDRAHDAATPVDGGVFDVGAGEVVVPIDAKLAVADTFAFAVTVERPGGVVVSDRSRIALAAGL